MYTYQLINDIELVNFIFHLPNNLPWICDDLYDGDLSIPYNLSYLYIGCFENERLMGVIIGIPTENKNLYLHLAFFPEAYGKTIEICKGVIKYIKKTTKYHTLWATVANNNELAQRLVKNVGFTLYKKEVKGWLKNGKEHGVSSYNIYVKE